MNSFKALVWRSFEVLVALLGIGLLALPFLLAATWVRLSSGRPVLLKQARVGQNQEPVIITKLRTMHLDASRQHKDQLNEAHIEKHGFFLSDQTDDRILVGARVLRRIGIDEYPQLFQVLTGSLALVGPRPMLAGEVPYVPEGFSGRFSAKPGLTGAWQLKKTVRGSSWDALRIDAEWLRTRSLSGDIGIALATPFVMVLRALPAKPAGQVKR